MWHSRPLTRLELPRHLRDRLIADALAAGQHEICGLIAGHGERCTTVFPVTNISPTPETAFYMDPQSQIDAMMAIERDGAAMLAIYHSHPRSAPIPSPSDRRGAAYPGTGYIIISTADTDAPAIAAYVFEDDDFRAIALECAELAR